MMAGLTNTRQRIKDAVDLRDLAESRSGRHWVGDKVILLCPLHEEKAPSFTVWKDHFHYFGCGAHGDVFNYLEQVEGLVPDQALERAANLADVEIPPAGLTLAQYAAFTGLPESWLRHQGLTDYRYGGAPAVRIPHRRPDGTEAAVRYRIALKGDRFRWQKGRKAYPYGADSLPANLEELVLVEGVSDAQMLLYHGIPALGLPANSWDEIRDAPLVEDAQTIYVVIEPGKSGETLHRSLSNSSIRDRVRLLSLEPHKDPSELFKEDPAHFLENWRAAQARAVPWAEAERKAREEVLAAAYQGAEPLLRDPNLFTRVREAIEAGGYAGDTRPARLVYLAATSRLTDRPVNVALIAPSASGKNCTADAALNLMPIESYYKVNAATPHALAYSDESFAHRMVVFGEADSIADDGTGASIMRSIVDDAKMVYAVVEKDAKGHFRTREIQKEGPTGLITTSTHSLATQLGTRVLEIPVSDDEQQTRAVMRVEAQEAAGRPRRRTEEMEQLIEQLRNVQRYLAASDVRRVVVPYAEQLADIMPSTAVRMRRDFLKLISLIKAHTLLHQCQRDRTPDGALIATLDDYGAVRDLCELVFEIIVAEGVTPAIRETVEVVGEGEEVSEADLVRRLDLSKSTVSYRVNRALKGGWLVDAAVRSGSGHAKRLKRGMPLPEVGSALPKLGELASAFEHSNTHANASGRGTFGGYTPNGRTGDSSVQEFESRASGTVRIGANGKHGNGRLGLDEQDAREYDWYKKSKYAASP